MKRTFFLIIAVLMFFSSIGISCHLDKNPDYDRNTNEQNNTFSK